MLAVLLGSLKRKLIYSVINRFDKSGHKIIFNNVYKVS